jgi:hypothetical protein
VKAAVSRRFYIDVANPPSSRDGFSDVFCSLLKSGLAFRLASRRRVAAIP